MLNNSKQTLKSRSRNKTSSSEKVVRFADTEEEISQSKPLPITKAYDNYKNKDAAPNEESPTVPEYIGPKVKWDLIDKLGIKPTISTDTTDDLLAFKKETDTLSESDSMRCVY
jgi:hypothetical protein